MRILVCVKRVPAPGARINLTQDERAVDTVNLGFTVSPHEECAVEAAVQLVEAHGGSVTVMTLGPDDADEQLRHAVSVGADEAMLVATGGDEWDPQATAAALAVAIASVEGDRPFDLLLFGNESADAGGYQVGIRVARALGRPIVTGIKGIEVDEDSVLLRREVAGGFERYRLPIPAAAGVKEGIALPRYPTLKGRLGAKSAEIARLAAAEQPAGLTLQRLVSPPEERTDPVILADGSAAVDVFETLGLL